MAMLLILAALDSLNLLGIWEPVVYGCTGRDAIRQGCKRLAQEWSVSAAGVLSGLGAQG